jgi:AcrR family transcriptional regulator
MARPKSDDKRDAIMAAAIRVIASAGTERADGGHRQREAGVSNGSLFTYFETKADLLNQLYLELKMEMARLRWMDFRLESDIREQLLPYVVPLAALGDGLPREAPALALLGVSDDITPESRSRAPDDGRHRQAAGAEPRKWADARCAAGIRRCPDELAGRRDDRLHDP